MTVSSVILHLSSPVGRCVAKGRSAVRCTGWRTATCGAPPAAGKRPARDSPTERSPPMSRRATPTGTAAFLPEKGGGASFCMHLVFFSSKSQLSVQLQLRPCCRPPQLDRTIPAAEGTKGQRSLLLHCRPGFPVLPRHSHRSHFWETPVQLNSVKKKIDLKISPVFCFFFYVGLSVASFYVL